MMRHLLYFAFSGCLLAPFMIGCSTMSSTERQLDRVAFMDAPDIPVLDADAPLKPVCLAQEYSQNTVIISYDPETDKQALLKSVAKQGGSVVYEYNVINALAVRIPEGMTLISAAHKFAKIRGVIQVSKDYVNHLDNSVE